MKLLQRNCIEGTIFVYNFDLFQLFQDNVTQNRYFGNPDWLPEVVYLKIVIRDSDLARGNFKWNHGVEGLSLKFVIVLSSSKEGANFSLKSLWGKELSKTDL